MRPHRYRIKLTDSEETELKRIIRRQTTPQNKARRARIILLANGEGKTNKEIAKELGINLCDVTCWTKRWITRAADSTEERLSDFPRSGAPDRIKAEQWCQIMALACEPPEDHGLPVTQWTNKTLADEAIRQGIVDTISASHVGNFLKKKTCNPTEAVIG